MKYRIPTIILAYALTIFFIGMFGMGLWCSHNYQYPELSACVQFRDSFSLISDGVWTILLAINFLVLPSVFTSWMPEQVFQAWKRFATWAIPLTFIPSASLWYAVYHDAGGSFGIGGGYNALFVEFPIAVIFAWYFCTSLAVIGYAWWQGRKSQEVKLKRPVLAMTGVFLALAFSYWVFLVITFDFDFGWLGYY